MATVLEKPKSLDTGNDIRDTFVLELAEFSRRLSAMRSDYSRFEIMMAYMMSIYFYEGVSTVASILSDFEIGTDGVGHNEWDALFLSSHSLLAETYINVMIHGESLAERVRGHKPIAQRKGNKVSVCLAHDVPIYLHVLDGNMWEHKMRNTDGVRGFGSVRVKRGVKSGLSIYDNNVKRGDVVYVIEQSPFRGVPTPALKIAFNTLNLSTREVTGAFISYLTANIGSYLFLDRVGNKMSPMTYTDLIPYIDTLGFDDVPRELVVNHSVGSSMMSDVLGISPELICSPVGGSQERRVEMIRRSVNDTVYPLAMRYLQQIWYEMNIKDGIRLRVNL